VAIGVGGGGVGCGRVKGEQHVQRGECVNDTRRDRPCEAMANVSEYFCEYAPGS
jgi:hypothetical protein